MKFETYDVFIESLWLIQGDKSYGMLNKLIQFTNKFPPKIKISAIWVQIKPKTYIDSHKTSLQLALYEGGVIFSYWFKQIHKSPNLWR